MQKNQVFFNKKTGTIDHKTNIYQDKKTSKNILTGLEPKKVEYHWSGTVTWHILFTKEDVS